MQAGEKLYVALQSTGSQCQVTVDPIVSYVDEVYEARKEIKEENTGVWKATYNYPGNTHAGDAVWYAAGTCFRAANLDGAWGFINKEAVQTGTNTNRLPSQVFTVPKDGKVQLHFNAITTNGAFQNVTVFTRREGVVTTVDTITTASSGKTYSLSVLKGDEIGISYTNGTEALMKCSPVVYYETAPEILVGDCDGNGIIDNADVEKMREVLVDIIRLDEKITNVNDDEVTDIRDLVHLKKYVYEKSYGVNQVNVETIPQI